MGTWVHVLSDVNEEAKTAVCRNCGPVEYTVKGGRPKCPVARKQHKGVWTHGIGYESAEARAARIAAQTGLCAICQRETTLHRDHDHATGLDRSFLCRTCNLGLGNFNDNPELLEAAALYLRHHGTAYEPFKQDCEVNL